MVLPPWDNNYVVYGGWHASWLEGLLLRHQFSGAIPSKRVFFGKKKSCHWKKLLYLLILKADKSTKFTSMGDVWKSLINKIFLLSHIRLVPRVHYSLPFIQIYPTYKGISQFKFHVVDIANCFFAFVVCISDIWIHGEFLEQTNLCRKNRSPVTTRGFFHKEN